MSEPAFDRHPTTQNRQLAYKFRESDARDHVFVPTPKATSIAARLGTVIIPDPTGKTLIYDQGNLGDCVSNALAMALWMATGTMKMSRIMHYFIARIEEGTTCDDDSGLDIRQAVTVIRDFGATPETAYPYNTANFANFPSLAAFKAAQSFSSLKYQFVKQNLSDLKAAISQHHAIVFGVLVYDSFMSSKTAKTGMIPMPNTSTETLQGGHCIIAIGYDDNKQVFVFKNSWGTAWGNGGLGYLPYAYMLSADLASDFTVITI